MALQISVNSEGIIRNENGICINDGCPCDTECEPLCVESPTTIGLLPNGVGEFVRVPPDPAYPCESTCLDYNSSIYFLSSDGPIQRIEDPESPFFGTCYETWSGPGECGHIWQYTVSRSILGTQEKKLRLYRDTLGGLTIAEYIGTPGGTPMDCKTAEIFAYDGADDEFNDCDFTSSEVFLIGI